MKSLSLLFLGAVLALHANAESFRVNNQGNGADFTTINDAVAAAAANDTIYIEPSPALYNETVTLTTPLTLIGVGYFLSENSIASVTPITSQISTVVFNAGSAGGKLLGVHITSSMSINTSNITIERCRIAGINIGSGGTMATNATIIQNFITSLNVLNGSNIIVANNLINGSIQGCSFCPVNSVFTQNTVVNPSAISFSLNNSTVSNNIFNVPTIFNSSANISFFNNIGTLAGFLPAGNNNQSSVAVDGLFVGGTSPDGKFQLADGSPAEGAGVNGEDVGMFGGAQPYRISGVPPIPTITSLAAPNVVAVGQPFTVTINAQAND